jgi:hypothetical protein
MPNSTPDPHLELPRDVVLIDKWDTSALRAVVDRRCHANRKPSHLFLGKAESTLLREHLGEAFGAESVATFNALYYMGMLVIELDTPSCFRVAGEKFMDKIERSGVDPAKWGSNKFSEWELYFN